MDLAGHLNALSYQGVLLWTSTEINHFGSATKIMLTTADLDADGDLEILAGIYQ